MRILYIDTTTNYLYACCSIDDKIAGKVEEKLDKDLSVFSLNKIKEMLDNLSLTPNDIDKIIVVNGPGSFTGIRIGVTIAKTLAYSLKKDITTISSLQAMSCSSNKDTEYKVSAIDARRGFVYASITDNDNNSVMQDKYISLEALKCVVNNLPGEYSVITNDNIDVDNKEEYKPNFDRIIELYKNKETITSHAVNPIYLKLTEAEEKKQTELI